jgi:hypothetical protein
VLLVVWAVAIALVDPRADVPLIDDWTYAASVERIVAGHGFTVSSWSSTFPAAQIWWGALFAAAGGFSYTALRISTLVLAVAGTLALLGLLRALGIRAAPALLGALTFAIYPAAFVLSFTFMTDVPFVTATICSLWALVVGLRDARLAPIALGLLAATVAFLVRPVAVAIPAALLLTTGLHPGMARRGPIVALASATLAVMGTAAVVAVKLWPYAGEGGLAYRIARLPYLFLVSPLIYAEAFLSMLAHLGLAALPALAATARPLRRWSWRTAVLLLVAAVSVSHLAPWRVSALRAWTATWNAEELGAARPLLLGLPPVTLVRAALEMAGTVVGLLAGAGLLARVACGVARGGTLRVPTWTCVASFGFGSAVLCFALWFFYDRYYLPLVPVAVALALIGDGASGAGGPAAGMCEDGAQGLRVMLALLLIVALAVLDVTGARDMLAYARAVDAAVDRLHMAGVPYHRIDAGYVESGWHLHAHPENLPQGAIRERDVPHVTSAPRLPFVIANTPLPGYRVREAITVPSWWAHGDRIYVLEEE